EQTEKLAVAEVPAPAAGPNLGRFRPGDRRINREGRPRGSKAAEAAESPPADCARQADRMMWFSFPEPELIHRFSCHSGFWLRNLPRDTQVVDSRVDAATGRV